MVIRTKREIDGIPKGEILDVEYYRAVGEKIHIEDYEHIEYVCKDKNNKKKIIQLPVVDVSSLEIISE